MSTSFICQAIKKTQDNGESISMLIIISFFLILLINLVIAAAFILGKKKKKKLLVGSIILPFIPLFLYIFYAYIAGSKEKYYHQECLNFASYIGNINTISNSKLQLNINVFMESQKSELDLGKENYHCSNDLFGYDDKYAYAWVVCNGFLSKEEKLEFKNSPVPITEEEGLVKGAGLSLPTRLEYTQPDFQIVDFQQPMDGSQFMGTYHKLFPKEFYKKYGYSYAGDGAKELIHETEKKANP